jgi:hypothetical protein
MKTKYKGGFRLGKNEEDNDDTLEEAFHIFIDRLKEFRVLTDSSISCITLVLTMDGSGIDD